MKLDYATENYSRTNTSFFWWRPLIEVKTSKVKNFLVVSIKIFLVCLIQPNETFLRKPHRYCCTMSCPIPSPPLSFHPLSSHPRQFFKTFSFFFHPYFSLFPFPSLPFPSSPLPLFLSPPRPYPALSSLYVTNVSFRCSFLFLSLLSFPVSSLFFLLPHLPLSLVPFSSVPFSLPLLSVIPNSFPSFLHFRFINSSTRLISSREGGWSMAMLQVSQRLGVACGYFLLRIWRAVFGRCNVKSRSV